MVDFYHSVSEVQYPVQDEYQISHTREEDNSSKPRLLDRRNLLVGSTGLAAASALHSATSIQTAQAQQAAGQRPNILFIMG
jgi:hypothetical protein